MDEEFMHSRSMLQIRALLLWGLLSVLTGCGRVSAQSLEFLTVGATPSLLSTEGGGASRAVPHLGNGTHDSLDMPLLAWSPPANMPSNSTLAPTETAFAAETQSVVLGNNVTDLNGQTSANYFNSLYTVTGNNAYGYTVASGTMCFAPGTVTKGTS